MHKRLVLARCATLAAVSTAILGLGATSTMAKIMAFPTFSNEQRMLTIMAKERGDSTLQPPAPPCPENGMLPSTPATATCGVTELPATGFPVPGNMAYYGGQIQTAPKVYLVYWGWGQKGAFPSSAKCSAEKLVEGSVNATLKCDPDHAGRYVADWVYQMGGTAWAGTQTQYYEKVKDAAGQTYEQHFTNPSNFLGGIWADDTNPIAPLSKTSSANPAGPTNTYTDLAAEASRAAAHFGITSAGLANADVVVLQPANYSDPNAVATGYCAFHDMVYPGVEGGIYNHLRKGLVYTNFPYLLSINSSGINVCGENAVNAGTAGKLDGYSIALGHEIMESATDPGAEDVLGSGTSASDLGGWYDAVDADENGDKCAWVGENPATAQEPVLPISGAMGDIKGNHGESFAVQSLWSNDSAGGAGYCAGAGTDLPTG